MTGTEVNLSSAWAERTLAVLLLPFAFLVMAGGGAGLIWLWQDYRSQFWIGVCAVAVLAFLATAATSVAGRQQRRIRWLSSRADAGTAPPGLTADAQPGDSHALLLDLLSRVEAIQQDLDIIMGEFSPEQERSSGGRHSGQQSQNRSQTTVLTDDYTGRFTASPDDDRPLTVDIRDDVDDLRFERDDADDADEDDEFDPYDQVQDHSSISDLPQILEDDADVLDASGSGPVAGEHDDDELSLVEDDRPDDQQLTEIVAAENVSAPSADPAASEPVHPPGVPEPLDADISAGATATGDVHEPAAGREAGTPADSEGTVAAPADDAAADDVDDREDILNEPDQSAEPDEPDEPDEADEPDRPAGSGELDQPGELAERRMRRLVRDRSARPQWDTIPAPREPVTSTSIDLTADDRPASDLFGGSASSSFGSGIRSSLESLIGAGSSGTAPGNGTDPAPDLDEDDGDYFGEDLPPAAGHHPSAAPGGYRRDRSERDSFRDEYRSSYLGRDDDERPRDAR